MSLKAWKVLILRSSPAWVAQKWQGGPAFLLERSHSIIQHKGYNDCSNIYDNTTQMQQRKFPKPKKPAKSSLEIVSNVLSRYEPLVLVVSAVLSSIGIIAAAASTWIAWRQVELMSNERLTPFRVAMYQRQLDARSDLLDSMTRFEDAILCVGADHEIASLTGVSTERRRACVVGMNAPFIELQANVKRSVFNWPKPTRTVLVQYAMKGAEIQACASQALVYRGPVERGIPQIECAKSFRAEQSKLLRMSLQIQLKHWLI
jgi:hypothetical protein